MYDAFSVDYDRFVNWDSRLKFEMPFLLRQLAPLIHPDGQPARVLDAACATGRHAIALAMKGYTAAGADLSPAMIELAQANAARAAVSTPFRTAGFGALKRAFEAGPFFPFDAVLCLGNSLPHLLTPVDLTAALSDFSAVIRPGGKVVIQNRNFDAVLMRRERWMEPQAYQEESQEWIFQRFYDFDPDGMITFNVVTLFRQDGGNWQQRVTSTRLRPLRQAELTAALVAAGFGEIAPFGSLGGALFDPSASGNLVLVAIKL
jgi:glycine/sarcosine N-methyltransferase